MINNKVLEKITCILIYTIPWSNSLTFSNYLFNQFPSLKFLIIPAIPILLIENIIPFANIIIFLLIFSLIIRNYNVSYFLKFNALQSILITILLFIIGILFDIVLEPLNNYFILKFFCDFIFIVSLSIISFCMYQSLREKYADLPFISEAVKAQL
tara:strand:- start:445 stop:909 length:465 start_codon:yes stop_codon:yes gene_type:complete